jgi:hypothetical protein
MQVSEIGAAEANYAGASEASAGPSRQLMEIAIIFGKQNACYWLDSGTLLGIIREGQLLAWDGDIDIGIWWKPSSQLHSLLRAFSDIGYSIRCRRYKGKPYVYQLQPRQNAKARGHIRHVDLKMYRSYGDFAWCPAIRPTDRFKPTANASWLATRMQIAVSLFWMHVLPCIPAKVWPLPFFVEVCCWWVPRHHFHDVIRLENGLCVPFDYEEYLQYRYGDWHTPVPTWNFERDDQAFRHAPPEALFRSVDCSYRGPSSHGVDL